MKELTIAADRCEESRIFFGRGVSSRIERADFVITDSNVNRIYGDRIAQWNAPVFVMEAGEEHKNEKTLFSALEAMKDAGLMRGDTVLAFGGGVVGIWADLQARCICAERTSFPCRRLCLRRWTHR